MTNDLTPEILRAIADDPAPEYRMVHPDTLRAAAAELDRIAALNAELLAALPARYRRSIRHDRHRIDPQDALRAAINVLRDSHECGRMPNGNALPPDAKDVHVRAADCLAAMLRRYQPPRMGTGEPPCACEPSDCYSDCFSRHICLWQREQIDYWLANYWLSPERRAERKGREVSDG